MPHYPQDVFAVANLMLVLTFRDWAAYSFYILGFVVAILHPSWNLLASSNVIAKGISHLTEGSRVL